MPKKKLNLVKIAMDNLKPPNVFEKIDHHSGKIHQNVFGNKFKYNFP